MEKTAKTLAVTAIVSIVWQISFFVFVITVLPLLKTDEHIFEIVFYIGFAVAFILSVLAFVFSIIARMWKKAQTFTYMILSAVELILSVAGPVLFSLAYTIGQLD
ncbi:hypothetical protein SAMN02910456_00131 [Ruminococcaceae bacterium YRB3002]|nr:hypothetical protein SAMN02910456_00131 [Ruminococcaceae bacterium YRB3002]